MKRAQHFNSTLKYKKNTRLRFLTSFLENKLGLRQTEAWYFSLADFQVWICFPKCNFSCTLGLKVEITVVKNLEQVSIFLNNLTSIYTWV